MDRASLISSGLKSLFTSVCLALACADDLDVTDAAGGDTAWLAAEHGAGGEPATPAPLQVLVADEPTSAVPTRSAPDQDLRVAFFGDQGSGIDTKVVYQLVLDEGADAVILLGDFDYKGNAHLWASEMEEVLGPDFPVFAVPGNHDVKSWRIYQSYLKKRLANIAGAKCTGELGVDASCTFRGLHFILSGIGTIGAASMHESFIADTLAGDDSLWSLCIWHKTMRDLQAGDKPDEVTWNALRNCQNGGAIVVMAHEHSYARTRTLTDVGNEPGGHGAIGTPARVEVGPGRTFAAVSGLGGRSIRSYDAGLHSDDTWWATLYTSNYYRRNGKEIERFSADYGALFIRFHVGGDPKKAHAYFKNIEKTVVDEFEIVHR